MFFTNELLSFEADLKGRCFGVIANAVAKAYAEDTDKPLTIKSAYALYSHDEYGNVDRILTIPHKTVFTTDRKEYNDIWLLSNRDLAALADYLLYHHE